MEIQPQPQVVPEQPKSAFQLPTDDEPPLSAENDVLTAAPIGLPES